MTDSPTPLADHQSASVKQMSPRKAILLTLAAVAAVILIAATAIAFGVVYRNASHRADRNHSRAENLAGQVTSLKNQLATAADQLAAAKRRANAQYRAGYQAGVKSEQNFNKSLGLTYPKGWNAGYKAAFSGFDVWNDGSWYLVKIGPNKLGHEIESRYDIRPCQRMYMSNDTLYTGDYAC
jgi:hypothetical protein